MHGASGFDHASNGAESVTEALGEVTDLDLGRDRVFILAHQGKAGKSGGNIGDRGRHAAMDEAELLLVYLAQFDRRLNVSGLDHRQLAADVFHEFLTVQVVSDDLPKPRGLRCEVHGAKIPLRNGLQGTGLRTKLLPNIGVSTSMIDLILGMNWMILVGILTVLVMVLIVFTRRVIHRNVPLDVIREAHDVSAVVYTNLGVIYAIVVGLMAVHGQDRWIEVRETAERESGYIIAVGRSAQALHSPAGDEIVRRAVTYARAVADAEWDDDIDGPSPVARKAMIGLWDAVHAMEATTDGIKPASQTTLSSMNDLMLTRMTRISLMREHIGPLLWSILLGGGVLLIGFLVFFAPKTERLHSLLTLTVTVSVVSVLLLIFMYEHPTDGVLSLSPEPYRAAAEILLGR